MIQKSMVLRAAGEYARGNYRSALDLYNRLAKLLGEKHFQANISLCERQLREQGRRDCTRLPLRAIKVACIMDEFTFYCFEPECNLLPLTPENAIDQLESFNPDMLFIESAWRGKDELWSRKIGTLSRELKRVLEWCEERRVPTVFWNKEDPIHFETFLTTAQKFDHVFTTDIDCIARYKAALGHERVYLLPFACQPRVHNPIELYTRKNAFCFAGAYYVRYPERTRDLEAYLAEFPKYKPLEIFDRNFGKDDLNYKFPPKYAPYIVGNLPFNEIEKAYKGYRYAINVNSIKQSQTMFARRVYELLGSNTITVSNFSRGVRLLFGDLVLTSDNGKEIVDRLQHMDSEAAQKLRLAGLRKVMQEHTYMHRLASVARKTLNWCLSDALPVMVVVAKARSMDEFRTVIDHFGRQNYARKKLVLVYDPSFSVDESMKQDLDETTILSAKENAAVHIHEIVRANQWLAPMVADDYYGPNYLLDLAIATGYTDAQVIGKAAHYRLEENDISLINADQAYLPEVQLPMRSSAVRSEVLPRANLLLACLDCLEGASWKLSGLAVDPFNYCKNGQRSNNVTAVVKRVNDQQLDTGISMDELMHIAELIPPAEFDETTLPKWEGKKLYQLVTSPTHSQIRIKSDTRGLCINSTLPDGKHDYLYAREDLPIKSLPATKRLDTYLDATPGLNVQYVFVFLNGKKRKIGHVIHTANRNHTASVPDGTAFVRFGWRVSGSGAATINYLLWGSRKLEPAELLGRSDTLLLTNHYPQYDDLYRNGFVHSRVRAYQARGVKVDVFRLRPNGLTSYHEFQNVDVITGSQVALRKLLESGRYKTVFVHFLSPDMWETLAHYPTLKKIVWVHGAEFQPWHRRDYNYQSDQERAKAMGESDLRMAFWRGILSPLAPNLRLVFVSRYFAEEVMEDLGFRLPETTYSIIHNPIDTDLFSYQTKPDDLRKKVLSIRSYSSPKYANDLSVATIQALSRSPEFHQMEFRLIGEGPLFDSTLEPLRGLRNVIIERGFIQQSRIAELQCEYGIFLNPTRWDSQGVSRDEAMSAGLVPVTNRLAAIPEFVDESCGILAPPEDTEAMANGILRLVRDPLLFRAMSSAAAERVRRQSSIPLITPSELELIQRPTRQYDVRTSAGS